MRIILEHFRSFCHLYYWLFHDCRKFTMDLTASVVPLTEEKQFKCKSWKVLIALLLHLVLCMAGNKYALNKIRSSDVCQMPSSAIFHFFMFNVSATAEKRKLSTVLQASDQSIKRWKCFKDMCAKCHDNSSSVTSFTATTWIGGTKIKDRISKDERGERKWWQKVNPSSFYGS